MTAEIETIKKSMNKIIQRGKYPIFLILSFDKVLNGFVNFVFKSFWLLRDKSICHKAITKKIIKIGLKF